MKKLIFIISILATGCASHPTKMPYDDIQYVRPNCVTAKLQIEYLNSQIISYQDAHRGADQTEEDRKYIAKAKNIIWSLRSSCPANSL
jgi:glutaredoxin